MRNIMGTAILLALAACSSAGDKWADRLDNVGQQLNAEMVTHTCQVPLPYEQYEKCTVEYKTQDGQQVVFVFEMHEDRVKVLDKRVK